MGVRAPRQARHRTHQGWLARLLPEAPATRPSRRTNARPVRPRARRTQPTVAKSGGRRLRERESECECDCARPCAPNSRARSGHLTLSFTPKAVPHSAIEFKTEFSEKTFNHVVGGLAGAGCATRQTRQRLRLKGVKLVHCPMILERVARRPRSRQREAGTDRCGRRTHICSWHSGAPLLRHGLDLAHVVPELLGHCEHLAQPLGRWIGLTGHDPQ